MKIMNRVHYLCTIVFAVVLSSCTARAQTPPEMKMTTPIPPHITTPDSAETRIGTLKFADGLPDDSTVQKAYDKLDFIRGVEACQY